jgi:hypothetical protein
MSAVPNADNVQTGRAFEELVRVFFGLKGLALQPKIKVFVGAGTKKKPHNFDLGCNQPPVLVECKCHVWTEGGNTPSAKLTIWNEAMLYFAATPSDYRKILVVRKSTRGAETLAEHYVKRFGHLIPSDVELWELDPISRQGRCLLGATAKSGAAGISVDT